MKVEPIDLGEDFKLVDARKPVPEGWFVCTDFPYEIANLTEKWKDKNLILVQRNWEGKPNSDVYIVASTSRTPT